MMIKAGDKVKVKNSTMKDKFITTHPSCRNGVWMFKLKELITPHCVISEKYWTESQLIYVGNNGLDKAVRRAKAKIQ